MLDKHHGAWVFRLKVGKSWEKPRASLRCAPGERTAGGLPQAYGANNARPGRFCITLRRTVLPSEGKLLMQAQA